MSKVVFGRTRVALRILILLWIAVLPSAAQYTNGIYAEFNTSMGSYTCRLEYALAPKAVANFIALATGERSWLDLPSGQVKTNPFFNGTTFHRVIAGFMNQGGSRNALGTDGPGYAFIDEFTPSLRHDSFGVLSMANSGPDSNGSQFFITAAATPWLNDIHTVFGKLYGGSNVVYAINHVATDGNSKPLTNVVLNSVLIKRVGAAANAFNIHGQSQPLVTNLNLKIAKSGTNVSLSFSNRINADNRLYSSTNLASWTATQLGIETVLPVSQSVTQSAAGAAKFFRAAQVQYASGTLATKTVYGRTFALTITNGGSGTLTITFNSSGGGTYTFPPEEPGTVTSYTWIQEPFNGKLWPIYYSGLIPMTLQLNYDARTMGTFKGTGYPDFQPPFNFFGTFTTSP